MALRSDRHRTRPIAALALDAGTTIGPRWATIPVGPQADDLHAQAGYTTAADSKDTRSATRLKNREESIYGLLVDALVDAVQRHSGPAQSDDFTVVVARGRELCAETSP
jgi:hypothetical protein